MVVIQLYVLCNPDATSALKSVTGILKSNKDVYKRLRK